MSTLNISLVQADLAWQQPRENREHLESMLAGVSPGSDLVILPEMFTTGFTMQAAEFAESMDGPGVSWMQARARQLDAAVCGSLIITEGGRFVNRFVLAEPGGVLHYYDKRHLFGMAGEDGSYVPGRSRSVIEFRGWRICPMICYDLRFPGQYQSLRLAGAQVIMVPAAFTMQTGRYHWNTLLQARAIETQCFIIAPGLVGS